MPKSTKNSSTFTLKGLQYEGREHTTSRGHPRGEDGKWRSERTRTRSPDVDVDVEVIIDWDSIRAHARKAAYSTRGKTAFGSGAVTIKVTKKTVTRQAERETTTTGDDES